jgi:hypothetical protein
LRLEEPGLVKQYQSLRSGRRAIQETALVSSSRFFLLPDIRKYAAAMMKHAMEARTAELARCGLDFRSGTLGESITRNPNCSRFRPIISRSTSCPYNE